MPFPSVGLSTAIFQAEGFPLQSLTEKRVRKTIWLRTIIHCTSNHTSFLNKLCKQYKGDFYKTQADHF